MVYHQIALSLLWWFIHYDLILWFVICDIYYSWIVIQGLEFGVEPKTLYHQSQGMLAVRRRIKVSSSAAIPVTTSRIYSILDVLLWLVLSLLHFIIWYYHCYCDSWFISCGLSSYSIVIMIVIYHNGLWYLASSIHGLWCRVEGPWLNPRP